MKIVNENKVNFVLRFDKGEEVISGLQSFMASQQMSASSFSGIGASSLAEIGSYNTVSKQSEKHVFEEDLEIISLLGNGGLLDGKPVIHTHGTFSKRDFSAIGGHVFKVIVSATCEISLTRLEGELNRAYNEEFNLNLFV